MFVTMVLILIFGEVLGLYGYVIRSPEQSSRKLMHPASSLIVALIMNSRASEAGRCP